MNTLALVNRGRFSFVVYLNSWALPLHIDRVPGSGGWTYRVERKTDVFSIVLSLIESGSAHELER